MPLPDLAARERLAIAAHAKARAADNRFRTPATANAREAAVTELRLATLKVEELMARAGG